MPEPTEILNIAYKKARENIDSHLVSDPDILERVEYVCRNKANRAGTRFLIACLLAKIHKPEVDIRKPYTEIPDDSYSGRYYDEQYVTNFINKYNLPCNSTTAFLTPGFRTMNQVLTQNLVIEGRPKEMYTKTIELLSYVHGGKIDAEKLLIEIIICLLQYKAEKEDRMDTLLKRSKGPQEKIPLSTEAIVTLIQQHLDCPRSSRLPVLVVAAAYRTAEDYLGERVLPLKQHTAADEQTGSLGDLEITLVNDENIITSYEMKTKRVQTADIDRALTKIVHGNASIDNYIFITTEDINEDVNDYAKAIYEKTGGIEIAILDCIGFIRHFLHLFHRLRSQFLDEYQKLLLDEPESAVRQSLKESFLVLRKATETEE